MKGYINADALLTPIFVERERRESRMQTVKEHVHNFYEIYFLVDGKIDKFIESRTYHLKPFDFVIIPPNVLHKSILCDDYRHERIVVYFDNRSVNKNILDALNEYKGVVTPPAVSAKRIFKLLNILLRENNSDEWHDEYVSGVLSEMLVIILRSSCVAPTVSSGIKIEGIIDYIRENCCEHLSLEDVAKKFFVSSAHLSRLFHKHTGFTFTQYINYQRIIHAQAQLSGGMAVGEAATKSGFENLTHFGRVFKQITGCSPRDYRKNILDKNKL